MRARLFALIVLAPAIVFAESLDESIPDPWFKNGVSPAKDQCLAGIDTEIENSGLPNLSLQCAEALEGFVGVMQSFSADNYLGKRLMFSARVKSQDIEDGWGGLWMRIDGRERKITAFDNMQKRAIKGTTDWTRYAVVLDVAKEATAISFGTLMSGSGQLWISDLELKPVDLSTPTTGQEKLLEPGNLELQR